ncbi:MAG: pseudouridine synthase [Eubacteriales bacterium]
MRLDKYLTQAALGTKKDVKQMIRMGLICVNDIPAEEPCTVVEQGDIITYQGQVVENTKKMYYMFHKPAGCLCARKDENRNTIFSYFQDIDTTALFPVGRLDMDTEGILLLTNDGEFNHKLMHPTHHVEKTYVFWAFGILDEEKIKQLEEGILLDGLEMTKPAKIRVLKAGAFETYEEEIRKQVGDLGKRKKNLFQKQVVLGELIISEGKKHQVKRMLKEVGCYIVYLKRTAIGNLLLDENLELGYYRELKKEEIQRLSDYKV